MTAPDPLDPTVWNLMMLRGIVGLQAGRTLEASTYLRFVVEHRGRAVADCESLAIRRMAASRAYAEADKLIEKLVNRHVNKPASATLKATPKVKKKTWSTAAGNTGRPVPR